MTTRRKPVRVRKARWRGVCPRCRAPITHGQLVASMNRRPWTHAAHLAEAARAAADARRLQAPGPDGQAGTVIAALIAAVAEQRARRGHR